MWAGPSERARLETGLFIWTGIFSIASRGNRLALPVSLLLDVGGLEGKEKTDQ